MKNILKWLMILLSGALFGFGLSYSTMIHPETVLAFLTLHDMGLLLVLCTAVAVNLVVFQLVPRLRSKPVFGEAFEKRPFADHRRGTIRYRLGDLRCVSRTCAHRIGYGQLANAGGAREYICRRGIAWGLGAKI